MPTLTGPESINLDYRIVAMLLALATREELLDSYINDKSKKNNDPTKWKQLRELGFPFEMLQDNLYVFENAETRDALHKTQKVMETLVSLNDYCKLGCPTDPVLGKVVGFATTLTRPLPAPGEPN